MAERRRIPRVRSSLSGVLEFNAQGSPIACRVLTHSAEGATVEVDKRVIVPSSVDFTIREMNICHRSTVIWRTLSQIGVRYGYVDAETRSGADGRSGDNADTQYGSPGQCRSPNEMGQRTSGSS